MQELKHGQPITSERLFSVVEELERGLASLTAAVAEVRGAIVLLQESPAAPDESTYIEPVAIEPAAANGLAAGPTEASVDDTAREEALAAVERAKREASWLNMPVDAGLGFAPQHLPATNSDDPEAATREEVRRMVEAAREEMLDPEGSMFDEAELSETVEAPQTEAPQIEAPQIEAQEAEPVGSEPEVEPELSFSQAPMADLQDEVAVADAAVPDEVIEVEAVVEETDDEAARLAADEARREQVRMAVEAAKAEMLVTQREPLVTQKEPLVTQAEPEPQLSEDEARREAVRRAVEEARNQMNWGSMPVDSGNTWGQFKPEPGGFTIRPEEPAPAAAAPMEPAADISPAAPAEAVDDDEARREAVRRAVEAAKAEMMRGEEPLEERPRIAPVLPRPDAMPRGADFSGPPLIVIEDPQGRVELSQVFATLSKVNRSSQAALLNYSPHSVTIGLNMLSSVPAAEELIAAAQSVFGRECSVKTDGARTAVSIGSRALR